MGPWQTGSEGAWSPVARGGSREGGSDGVREDPGLNEEEKKVSEMCSTAKKFKKTLT